MTQWTISFRWVEDDQPIIRKISRQETDRVNRNGGVIKIGSEKLSGNLYLEGESALDKHAEIYFNEQQQKFFAKNLQSSFIAKVNGIRLPKGNELPLKNGDVIDLGLQQIEVLNIQLYTNESTVICDDKQWQITFEWEDSNGNLKSKQISQNEAIKDDPTIEKIRIGRESLTCNPCLDDSSVSRQHAEIYFHKKQKKFFIKNLSSHNITKVDGKTLSVSKSLPLKENSIIVLGRQEVKVNLSGSNTKDSESIEKEHKDKYILAMLTAAVTLFVGLVGAGVTWYNNSQTQQTEMIKLMTTTTAEKEKARLSTESAEKLAYIDRMTKHKAAVISLLNQAKKDNTIVVHENLILRNDCEKTVNFAVSYQALDDLEETKGWFSLKKNEKLSPGFYTSEDYIYICKY